MINPARDLSEADGPLKRQAWLIRERRHRRSKDAEAEGKTDLAMALRLMMLLTPRALAFRSHVNCVKPGPQPLSESDSIVVGPEMNEERAGFVIEHVIVDGGDLDIVVP